MLNACVLKSALAGLGSISVFHISFRTSRRVSK